MSSLRGTGHFGYYPGGHVEWGETIRAAAERECREECDDEFIFEKILYIRDFFDQEKEVHSVEFFILGKLKNDHADNSKDPAGRKSQILGWVEVEKIPADVYPQALGKKLPKDFKSGFADQPDYVGVIK